MEKTLKRNKEQDEIIMFTCQNELACSRLSDSRDEG